MLATYEVNKTLAEKTKHGVMKHKQVSYLPGSAYLLLDDEYTPPSGSVEQHYAEERTVILMKLSTILLYI